MRIRSIRIEDFRKLTGPICIEGIGDAITVISGDNEEGKSTVLEAIRTVLFTRHRVSGDTADRMQPFGQSVRPEISLDFEIDGNGSPRPSGGSVDSAGIRLGARVAPAN